MFKFIRYSLPCDSSFRRIAILTSIIVAAILGVMSHSPIPQDTAYHHFADIRTVSSIPNGSNVVSNAFFFLAGIAGVYRIRNAANSQAVFRWRFFFVSIALVGLGSAYYHWAPSNDSLFWDRLPMTLGFASLTVSLLAERFGERTGRTLFWPLIILSAVSVVYWWFTEKVGAGDLRPYILVQYIPLVLAPMLLMFFPKESRWDRPYWILLAGYGIAKGLEWQDFRLYEWTYHLVSGHALKHFAAAAAILLFRPHIKELLSKNIAQDK